MAAPGRFERPTFNLGGCCSILLSYGASPASRTTVRQAPPGSSAAEAERPSYTAKDLSLTN